jgi:ribosomal protein S6
VGGSRKSQTLVSYELVSELLILISLNASVIRLVIVNRDWEDMEKKKKRKKK